MPKRPALSVVLAAMFTLTSLPASAQTVGDQCSANGGSNLLDCQCVEQQANQLLARDKSRPADEVFDRAAAQCPSLCARSATPGDPRYRQHSFEERQAIRRIALEFAAELDSSPPQAIIAKLVATAQSTAALQLMPHVRPQFD